MAVASSVEAKAGDKLARVGFSNSYRSTIDDAAILRVTGERGAAFFKQSFGLKGDLIPQCPRRCHARPNTLDAYCRQGPGCFHVIVKESPERNAL